MGESPGPVPCRGCGGALEAEAKFCARCGRSRDLLDATMIELRPLGTSMTTRQTAVVTTRPPDRKRTLSLLGVLAVIALVAFGLVKTFDGGSAGEATSPTSTVPETTTIPETTTAPPTTAPVTVAVTPAVPLITSAPTTTSIPYVNQRRGAVLDEAQGGRSIYVANVQDLWRIELDTGRVTSRQISSTFNGFGVLGVIDGRVVLTGLNGQTLSWLPADLSGTVTAVATDGFTLWRSRAITADGIWLLRWSGPNSPAVVRRIDLGGKVRAEITLPANAYPSGVIGDRAVITQFGRIWTVGADGKPVTYATGAVVSVDAGYVLWVGCDDVARCTFRLGTATDPDTKRTSLETSYLVLSGGEGDGLGATNSLAPDGATVVGALVTTGSDPQYRIVDLATGSALELSGQRYTTVAWTPSGDWVLEITAAGDGVATNVRTGRKVVLRYPLAFTGRNGGYVASMTVG